MRRITGIVLGLSLSLGASAAGGPVELEHVQLNLANKGSLTRGAALFVNYCMGCHSMQYMRYSRLMEDLDLTEEQVEENLIFGDAKIGDHMISPLSEEDAIAWLGVAPPDLTLMARTKIGGADWIYTFLKGFYADRDRPTGWNNTIAKGTSMPHVLASLQGIQALEGEGEDAELVKVQPGSMSEAEYDAMLVDLTNFMAYAAEPGQLKRKKIGVWVLLYLALFTFLAWLLKHEYWKDVDGHH